MYWTRSKGYRLAHKGKTHDDMTLFRSSMRLVREEWSTEEEELLAQIMDYVNYDWQQHKDDTILRKLITTQPLNFC